MSQLKTIPAPYGKDVVDDDGNKMSHVIGAGVDQGAAPLRTETLGENLKAIVEKHPSKECIVDVYADVSFTYERFYNRVLRLATAFVRAGYRMLYQDHKDGGFEWDVTYEGPVVGLTTRF